MSIVSADVMKDVLGSQAVTDGGVAGFGIHYDVSGDTNVDPNTSAVDVKLDQSSLDRARAISGATNDKAPQKGGPKTFAQKQQEKGENRYAALFDNRGFSPDSPSRSPQFTTGSKYDALNQKNPLARVKQRRLLELRRTFDMISKASKKPVPINPESLPQQSIEDMVKVAEATGNTMTPVGTIERAMKKAGLNGSKHIQNAYDKWQHALLPGSWESMPSGPSRGGGSSGGDA